MVLDVNCGTCDEALCLNCPDFEELIEQESDLETLKKLRCNLMQPSKGNYPWNGRLADFIVSKVSTLKFFTFCIFLSLWPMVWKTCLPTLWPSVQDDVLFISNTFQLTLLPIILIASARSATMDRDRSEREYRMMLLSERIDELKG
jgi:hypothetical protein